MKRYKTKSAVYALIISEDKILLQKRKGFEDGNYDVAALGHVENNESMKLALQREIKEEINLDVHLTDIEFAIMLHSKYGDDIYYNGYFLVKDYQGDIEIKELESIYELEWFDINNLPDNIISDRKIAIQCYLAGSSYEEYGW